MTPMKTNPTLRSVMKEGLGRYRRTRVIACREMGWADAKSRNPAKSGPATKIALTLSSPLRSIAVATNSLAIFSELPSKPPTIDAISSEVKESLIPSVHRRRA